MSQSRPYGGKMIHESLESQRNGYGDSGLRLGWLILPASTEVEVYTSSGVEVLTSPQALIADPTLPGFKLDLASIWNPPF